MHESLRWNGVRQSQAIASFPRRSAPALLLVLLLLLFALLTPAPVQAQACESHAGEVQYGHLEGLRIDSIVVASSAPELPQVVELLSRRLHTRTTTATLRRLFQQDEGTVIDTLRLAESMRGLHRSPLLASVQLDTRECPGDGNVRLTLRTTDAWSARGRLRLGRDQGFASLGEDNLFGSGRSVRTSFRVDQGQPGFGVAYTDPWVLGSGMALSVSRDVYRAGSELRARVSSSPRSVLDPWRADLAWAGSSRQSLVNVGDRVNRIDLQALAERRVRVDRTSVAAFGLGLEHVSAQLVATPSALLVGPARVTRDFTGLTASATRRSLTFVSRPLMPASGALVDLPSAMESDVATSFGRDAVTGLPAQHLDAWLGKLWPVRGGGIFSANGWWSGYRDASGWSAGDGRLSLLALAPAARGQWSVHAASEVLLDPDPDTRTLLTYDPAARLLPARGLAEAISLLTIERDVRIVPVGRSYVLGGALFTSASRRLDLAGLEGKGRQDVLLVGSGLRLLPSRIGRATLRLDVAVPVGNDAFGHRPFVSFTVAPWFEHERHRAGRRTP
ncbi:MAG: hypothetical protein ABI910_03205 [Gemmatimonadota bacterium]